MTKHQTVPPGPPKLGNRENNLLQPELTKVFFQLAYWALVSVAAIIIYKSKFFDVHEVPESIEHYVSDKLNLWIYGFELIVLIILAGVAALAGSPRLVSLAREEVARLCYTLGCFAGGALVVLGVIQNNPQNYIQAFFVILGYCVIGVGIAVYFNPDKSQEK